MKPQSLKPSKPEERKHYVPRSKPLMDHLVSPETRHKLHCLKNHLTQVELQAKKKAEKQAAEDDKIIRQYLTDHGLTATKTSTGLYYIIETQGTGPSCISTSDVKVAYKGYFTDGSVFDQSSAAGITFNLQGVIAGWTEGIPFFKEGWLS